MGQSEKSRSRKRKVEAERQERADKERNDSKSPKKKMKRKETVKKSKSSDNSSQGTPEQSQDSFLEDEVVLQTEEEDEFLNEENSSKGTPMASQGSFEQQEDQPQYTVTEVPDEQQAESEVQFRMKAAEQEGRQDQMMKDIGEFFNDSKKLDRVWNLVKAINASDKIEQQRKERTQGDDREEGAGLQGKKSIIDASKLINRERSETTIYDTSEVDTEITEGEAGLPVSSPDMTSSDDAISPIEFTDKEKTRRPPPSRLPLPPPPPPQAGTSTGGWTATGSDRVRRTKQKARDEVEEATKLRTNPVKPAGKDLTSIQGDQQRLMNELLSRNSNISVIAESLSALTTDAEFDPLEIQLDGLTLQKIQQGAYVDLRKLIQRDTIGDDAEEDDLHWVLQDGTPKLKRKGAAELLAINGYRRWMTAFTSYARIYSKEHPERANELHQYILDIQDASNTYTWDSVYKYDKIFRMYMEKKPWHDWGTPNNKYWNKTLKKRDRETFSPKNYFNGSRQTKKVCWKFNKFGRCDRGKDCEFEHRCGFCGKFGHHKGVCYFNRENKEERRDFSQENGGKARHKKKGD